MSKAKKRKKEISPRRSEDRHHQHLCYQERHWKSRALKELRSYPYCSMLIPRASLHQQIHEWVSDIPAPREVSAREALKNLRLLEEYGAISETDPIEKRLLVLIALFDSIEQLTADGFRKQLYVVREYLKKPP